MKKTIQCSEKDCKNLYYARGLCRRHYRIKLGKEGGYIRDYEKRKNNQKYKEMKRKSDHLYRERLKREGVLKEKQQKYYENHISKEGNLDKKRARQKEYYLKNKEKRREINAAYQRRYRDELKREVLLHYSKGKMECAHCAISVEAILTLDHINNDGAEHRRKLSKTGKLSSSSVYRDIIKSNFPEKYQVLCFNCNFLKEFERKTLAFCVFD